MGLAGNISTMPITEVFQFLNTGQKSGTLRVTGPNGVKKDIYFKDGLINSASSNDPRELVGQFLLGTNKVSEHQLLDALRKQKRDHVLLGKILVQQNIITKEEFFNILRNISEEIIYDLFLWDEGTFKFKDNELPNRELPSFNFDITQLILEGVHRVDEWKRIQNVFPDDQMVVKPVIDKIAQAMPLDSDLAHLLPLINGFRTIPEISRIHKAGKYQTHRIMLELHEAGLIQPGDFRKQLLEPVQEQRKDPVKDMVNRIESLIDQGNLDDAEVGLSRLRQMAPSHPDLARLKDLFREQTYITTARSMINPNSVPVLAMDVNDITKMDLNPAQGFLLSRINGSLDVNAILKMSPFEESICIKILKQFMDDGVITLQ